MLVNSIKQVNDLKEQISLSDDTYTATMRMPIRLEDEMILKFEKRRVAASSIWNK